MNKKAFSLIELSIVLLIIGIIIAGITQSSRLVSEFKLNGARNQTRSSPVSSIPDLILWLETTLENSFLETEAQENESDVTTWYDLNPQTSLKNNATQTVIDDKPHYTNNCINSLPCLRFDGSNHYFDYDGTVLANTNFTIFVVEQRRSNKSENYFLAGDTITSAGNLHLGYRSDQLPTFSMYGNDLNGESIDTYSSPIPRIHSYHFSSSTGKKYYINGVEQTLTANGTETTGLSSYEEAKIGLYQTGSHYNGDIAEIIMFTRDLKVGERESIDSYLLKKWGID